MLSFLATILSTVVIFLLFPSFKRWGIRTAWAITVNYFVAGGLGWMLAGGVDAMHASIQAPWIVPLSLIGVCFYPLFRLTATCSQELGISVATIATKLSMAIPVLVLAWPTACMKFTGDSGWDSPSRFPRCTCHRARVKVPLPLLASLAGFGGCPS